MMWDALVWPRRDLDYFGNLSKFFFPIELAVEGYRLYFERQNCKLQESQEQDATPSVILAPTTQ
jgi:hypothetical protein